MENFRMLWFLTIILLSSTFHTLSEAKHRKKLLSEVVGTVYCDTCFQQDFSKTSHFISGALVTVECSSNPRFHEEVRTNEHGEFKIHLPFSVSKHVKKIKGCSVKLISSSETYCSILSRATTSSLLHLKSRNKGTHIFSAGFFTFRPLKQPTLCNQNPSIEDTSRTSEMSEGSVDQKTFFSPIPQISGLPLIPFLPPPIFPPNPFLPPPSILPPNPLQPPPSIFPPNPFQPPPSLLPPNPFQPPPSIFPPNPFQPPPSPPSIFPPNPFRPPPPPPSIFPPNPFQPPPSPPPSMFPPNPFPPVPGLSTSSPGFLGISSSFSLKKTSP